MTLHMPTQTFTNALDVLCPMHLQIAATGHIRHAGPTICKLRPNVDFVGAGFLELFELQRPRNLKNMRDILGAGKTKLHLKLRDAPQTGLQGVVVPEPSGDGAWINMSFGISILEAVHDYDLTSADFAATDLAVEMLFLVEAKSAVLEESRKLNHRLQIAKSAAEKQAYTDVLTGLKNRRSVEQALEGLLAEQSPFCFLQLDLDFFKAVNDSYGHAAGDYVLQKVAAVLLDETRDQDDVARVGGDEFVIIMRGDIPKQRIAKIGGRIIQRIQEPVLFEGHPCQVSASIGISQVSDAHRLTVDQLMQQADKALYASKENGRSQFAFAEANTE